MSIPPKAQKKKPLFQDARQQNMIGLKQGYNMLNLLILWKNYHINLKQGADITLHFVCVSIRGGNWVASQVKKDFVWTRLPLKRSRQLANLHHEVISSSTRHTFGFLYETKGLHKQALSGSMARCFLNEALRVGRMQSSASKLLERSEEILYGPMIYRRKEMDLLCHNSIFGTICMKFRKANGLQQNETFRKAQCPIVECLTNSSMMHGRNNGKKVGPAVGISTGNELRVACYILERITEIAGVLVSFDPKLILVNFLSFNHVNDVSRIKDEILNMVTGTRLVLLVIIAHSVKEKGEYKVIKKAIEKMGLRHKEPIAAYRDGNERRLTRFHETTDINTFLMWQIYSCGT